MTNDKQLPTNEGEGTVKGARTYNRAARKFAADGRVEPAAQRAKERLDAMPVQHVAAENAGRRPARGEDPALARPAWWTGEHESRWARLKAAIRRDWEQTMHHLTGGSSGADLDQGMLDTLRQMRGMQPIPPDHEPTGVAVEMDWTVAEQAVRYGFGAADRFAGRAWSRELEHTLSLEWDTFPAAMPWPEARVHVYHGWQLRRTGATGPLATPPVSGPR